MHRRHWGRPGAYWSVRFVGHGRLFQVDFLTLIGMGGSVSGRVATFVSESVTKVNGTIRHGRRLYNHNTEVGGNSLANDGREFN